jgi:hypothetical protein
MVSRQTGKKIAITIFFNAVMALKSAKVQYFDPVLKPQ